MTMEHPARVGVVITAYNHAPFLGEAIRSVLAQTHPAAEIIVVDDGSTDHTAAVVGDFSAVRYVYQYNQGISAARNTGLRHCTSEFVVFLDADDRLLPHALACGVAEHARRPDCAFVAGQYVLIDRAGVQFHRPERELVRSDHYRALLEANFIGMHAAVMYRRGMLSAAGGFDPRRRACEDYDVYLRLARACPVSHHTELVAEYRQHTSNMSGNPALMLTTAVGLLAEEMRRLDGDAELRSACQRGITFYRRYYGDQLIDRVRQLEDEHRWGEALRALVTLSRYRTKWVRHHLITKARGAFRKLVSRPRR